MPMAMPKATRLAMFDGVIGVACVSVMVKRDFGLASRHVLVSTGADTDPLKFYCTEAATSYGRRFSKFEPRSGRHVGTGYQSNFRPGVYYTPKIDILDNPRFV